MQTRKNLFIHKMESRYAFPPRSPVSGETGGQAVADQRLEHPDNVWVQQSLQLPKHIADAFRDYGKANPGGIKHAGTAAVAIFMALPASIRDEITRSVMNAAWVGPAGVEGDWALFRLLELLKQAFEVGEYDGMKLRLMLDFEPLIHWLREPGMGVRELADRHLTVEQQRGDAIRMAKSNLSEKIPERERDVIWQLTRILDPELTPPPGEKASDKAKARDRKSG